MISELHRSIDQNIYRPIVRKYYDEFIRLGIDKSTDAILEQVPTPQREPIEWTLKSHVHKEKAVIPAYIANSAEAHVSVTNSIAAACDVLWAISLVYDDIVDLDQQRAGKPSSWIKYGKEQAMHSAQAGMIAVLSYLEKKVDTTTSDIFESYVNQGVLSIDKERKSTLSTDIPEILQIYEERCNFFQAAPADSFLHLGIIDKTAHSSIVRGFHSFTHATQVTNDLTDCSINQFGRPSFSDIKNGIVNIPISIAWKLFDENERLYFVNLFGKGYVSETDQFKLNNLFAKYRIDEKCRQLINSDYYIFLNAFRGILKSDYISNLEKWVDYKKQGVPKILPK